MASSGDRTVDRAALLGTSLAAVVALTFGGQGPWEWLASVVGLALLAVLGGFFRLPDGERAPWRERVALSAVAALCATLVVAAPLQLLLALATPVGAVCDDVAATTEATVLAGRPGVASAVLANGAYQAGETAYGECVGAATNRWMWAPALGFAVLGVGISTITLGGRGRPTG